MPVLQISAKVAQLKNLITLNLAVIIMSFTGILGALISLAPTHLVWYRLLIGIVSIYAYLKITRTALKVNSRALLKLFLTGAVLAVFWLCFFCGH